MMRIDWSYAATPYTGLYNAIGFPPLIQGILKPREIEEVKGRMGEEPQWLKAVLAVARLGEHMRYAPEVWHRGEDVQFITDEEHNLVEFT